MPLSVGREHLRVVGVEDRSVLWVCSSPRPKKFWIVVVLCTPFCHCDVARQVNWAASGAPLSTSRASSSACTLTPLSIGGHVVFASLSSTHELSTYSPST